MGIINKNNDYLQFKEFNFKNESKTYSFNFKNQFAVSKNAIAVGGTKKCIDGTKFYCSIQDMMSLIQHVL